MMKVECLKCGGNGYIRAYTGIAGGVCFSCGGKGYHMRKSAPNRMKTFKFSFLWEDENDLNYKNGDFCHCFNKKARNFAAAEKMAVVFMQNNGSQDYWVEEVS